MIVLHALWSIGSRLQVWGEVSGRRSRSSSPSARGRSARAGIPRHPFACSSDELGEAIEVAVGTLLPQEAEPSTLRLLLPTAAATPLASPELIGSGPHRAGGSAPELAPWSVASWGFDASDAIDLLLLLDLLGIPDVPDVAIGDSVRYWIRVARRAVEQVALGRFVPDLERVDDGYHATWRPPEALSRSQWFAALVAEMPGACRTELTAASAGDARSGWAGFTGQPPSTNAEAGFVAFLDAIVRRVLADSRHPRTRKGRVPTAFEAWVAALASADPRVAGDVSALASLGADLDRWMHATDADHDTSGFRTCFRINPPPEPIRFDRDETSTSASGASVGTRPPGQERMDPSPTAAETSSTRTRRRSKGAARQLDPPERGWKIEFLLQSIADPSLLIDAPTIWAKGAARLHALGGVIDQPQEKLLGDLGRARHLLPEIGEALRSAHPSSVELSPERAHGFLRETAPLLEQAGLGVIVPDWWNAPATRLGLKLTARTPTQENISSGAFGLEAVCSFEWKLSLGDHKLDAEEFRALTRLKHPLIRFRGQWVELDSRDIEAALRLLDSGELSGSMTTGETLRMASGVMPGPEGLPIMEVEASGWIAGLLDPSSEDRQIGAIEEPSSFAATLRPYQRRGLAWLDFMDGLGLGACLADDMGLGKTPQTLALLALDKERRTSRDLPIVGGEPEAYHPATILICPMSLVGNWHREAARFAPGLRVHVHHGAERSSGEAFRAAIRNCDLVITTYALAARDRDDLAGITWERIVLDEAQNIKNSGTRQAAAVRSIPASRRLALTGTPVENRLTELWSILDFLNPGLLGSRTAFTRAFAVPIERYRDEDAAKRLRRLTAPFILRRLKTDRSIIQDLPEKVEFNILCNLTREQASLYQAVVDDMLEKADQSEGIERRGIVLAGMTRLKQICNHPTHFLSDRRTLDGQRSGKLARLGDILEEILALDERVLIFTQYTQMGRPLSEFLGARFGREVLFLHGGTRRDAREAMVDAFQSADGPSIFILSLKAGGTGLNLTAANHVIHFDRWWNPAVEDQATDRAYRIGQTRGVQVRKLVCVGTLEERIDRVIAEKRQLAENIIGSGEDWLTELSTAQLRDLVRLSAEAVAE